MKTDDLTSSEIEDVLRVLYETLADDEGRTIYLNDGVFLGVEDKSVPYNRV